MPSADDIARWRADAKSLRAAVEAGDAAALDRVLAAHPKYVDRPLERLRSHRTKFSLNDAQLTIAREQGVDSWSMLCDQGRRWPHPTRGPQQGRAMRIALDRGDRECGAEHLLLALAAPKRPTAASAALAMVDADFDALHLPAAPPTSDRREVATTPHCVTCVTAAAALAIAEGCDRITDEHLLLALMYTAPEVLHRVNADPDELYDALVERGVQVPPTRPPAKWSVRGPYNDLFLYVRRNDLGALLKVLRTKHPIGTEHWGFNYSKDDPDEACVISEDEIDIEAIAREALGPDGHYRLGPPQPGS